MTAAPAEDGRAAGQHAEDVAVRRAAVAADVAEGPAGCTEDASDGGMFDAVAYINTPRWRHSKPGLARMQALAERLGHPERDLRFVHVAGTNGKGSTCAYLSCVLAAAGYRTGRFTSPYVERFEERISVDGRDIAADDLLQATLEVREAAGAVERAMGEHPTEFELMCAVALVHFRRMKCDIVVLEVGLGGALDATNIVTPEVSVIAPISLDHTDLLGDTVAQIAREKAGIVKPGVPVASAAQVPEAMLVIGEACERLGCDLAVVRADELQVSSIDAAELVRRFAYRGERFQTRMVAAYQPENAALAIEAVRALRAAGWRVTQEALKRGIAQAVWPGRFEVLRRRAPVIVDGAHNPQGAAALARSLDELGFGPDAHARKAVLVAGVLADKDHASMMRTLAPYACAVFTYAPDNPRALSADDLALEVRALAAADVPVCACATPGQAACAAMAFSERAAEDVAVVAFGSLYSIGRLKAALRCRI